ncbi:hypothetical protein ACFQ3Z_24350 [Streptomyces nogalater]
MEKPTVQRSAVADTGAPEPGRPARSGGGPDTSPVEKGAVQRRPAEGSAGGRTPQAGAPRSGSGPDAPLLGKGAVRPGPVADSGDGSTPVAAGHPGDGPATPLVTPSRTAASQSPADTGGPRPPP